MISAGWEPRAYHTVSSHGSFYCTAAQAQGAGWSVLGSMKFLESSAVRERDG
jgi:hypothetical protein